MANEFLADQLPDVLASTRQQLVGRLVGGYSAHNSILSRQEARERGLRVQFASQQEERLLWDVLWASRPSLDDSPTHSEGEAAGLIASAEVSARLVPQWAEVPPWGRQKVQYGESLERTLEGYWEIERKGDVDGL